MSGAGLGQVVGDGGRVKSWGVVVMHAPGEIAGHWAGGVGSVQDSLATKMIGQVVTVCSDRICI